MNAQIIIGEVELTQAFWKEALHVCDDILPPDPLSMVCFPLSVTWVNNISQGSED